MLEENCQKPSPCPIFISGTELVQAKRCTGPEHKMQERQVTAKASKL